MESWNKIHIGTTLGFYTYKYAGWQFQIGRIIHTARDYVQFEVQRCDYQSGGLDVISCYNIERIIELPINVEILKISGFVQITPENDPPYWKNSTGEIEIYESKQNFTGWNVIIRKAARVVLSAEFQYLHELQTYCIQKDTELNIRLADVMLIYKDYKDPKKDGIS